MFPSLAGRVLAGPFVATGSPVGDKINFHLIILLAFGAGERDITFNYFALRSASLSNKINPALNTTEVTIVTVRKYRGNPRRHRIHLVEVPISRSSHTVRSGTRAMTYFVAKRI